MAIKSRLSALMGERRLKMTEVARITGVGRKTIWLLYHDKLHQVPLHALDRLCAGLGVQPGDILVYVPEEAQRNGNH